MFNLIETNEELFFKLQLPQIEDKLSNAGFYLDATDERFWKLYTVAKHKHFERLINYLQNLYFIDKFWLPAEMLNALPQPKDFKGYNAKFSNDYFFTEEDSAFSNISLQTWGATSKLFLDTVAKNPKLSHLFSMSGVRLINSLDDSSEYVIENIHYDGKTSTVGTSFESHLEIVNSLVHQYKNLIVDYIEKSARKQFTHESFNTTPILITIPNENINMLNLTKKIFSGLQPFKLLGTTTSSGNDFQRIECVDLHTGGRLTFEVKESEILIFIHSNTCGNTVARFYVNVQQSIDSKSEIKVLGLKENFKFKSITNG